MNILMCKLLPNIKEGFFKNVYVILTICLIPAFMLNACYLQGSQIIIRSAWQDAGLAPPGSSAVILPERQWIELSERGESSTARLFQYLLIQRRFQHDLSSWLLLVIAIFILLLLVSLFFEHKKRTAEIIVESGPNLLPNMQDDDVDIDSQ